MEPWLVGEFFSLDMVQANFHFMLNIYSNLLFCLFTTPTHNNRGNIQVKQSIMK